MKEVIAIRHVGFEHLGSLAPVLSGRGYRIRYLDAGLSDFSSMNPEQPALMVVLGAPIGAYEGESYPFLTDELALIERRLAAERPTLGICLGAQLMARVLGSRVYPGSAKEIGWGRIRLTQEGESSCLAGLQGCDCRVLHWHGDTFDLPEGATRLASSQITENQAFALGDKALGLQFHLEVDPLEIERWLIGHAHEIAATGGADPNAIRSDTGLYGGALVPSARACFESWMATAGL